MAKRDQLTEKGPLTGNKRSHALNQTKRKWNLNLQRVKIWGNNGEIIEVKVSARTLKMLKKHNKVVRINYHALNASK
ncbi:50S ribosomal protein L28 [Malacoplasma iowae]|uniref:Large ribosomal subunit protein bL28 n=1 Tax=Malacoplasma iowae 695 TaxID=1048830 RepID=A0A6P1LFD7_MALIO|nr:50S ribosomal protein L28 [Malacoplasma iowae]VEU61695.1 50S ribosomal protein L28 [Mycoplasmopsis fermentans]EGZ30905.1 ribosomal protein L28 [Malacoplasma iowae 695]QHG90168.1 50S ribosomal protein L28 [Malacoplasma iowae 695]WPL36083.1 50S ribosomal protein L28 [Malacoplasma iowae]VEU71161.1 50S ribosomal protein L28 [Malacoplasma iowae]